MEGHMDIGMKKHIDDQRWQKKVDKYQEKHPDMAERYQGYITQYKQIQELSDEDFVSGKHHSMGFDNTDKIDEILGRKTPLQKYQQSGRILRCKNLGG
jgi:putative IMPACT (imprinted ancient) family translation regulator